LQIKGIYNPFIFLPYALFTLLILKEEGKNMKTNYGTIAYDTIIALIAVFAAIAIMFWNLDAFFVYQPEMRVGGAFVIGVIATIVWMQN
jgi:hypothetical protein